MRIALPDAAGRPADHILAGRPVEAVPLGPDAARVVYAAAHVVADPFADADPSGLPAVDWAATMAFRRHLAGLGLGIAEAMDTAQRGMGLPWPTALELVRRTREELPGALLASGAGTDHLDPLEAHGLDAVRRAYLDQVDAVQATGSRVIVMASRALVRAARGPDDYRRLYAEILAACDRPAILHWLGAMFDPALDGYWGAPDFETQLETVLAVIGDSTAKVDGIKISLLDKDKEILLRRRLPVGVRMYTGDDFNYPELIEGDAEGHSDALLGIFDPLAPLAATAVHRLGRGDAAGFRALLDPTVPLARTVFRAPTRHYKTGVVFLAWLNGFQDHFVMVGGAEAMRPLPYFTTVFRQADACGLLRDPDLAVHRMRRLLAMRGFSA